MGEQFKFKIFKLEWQKERQNISSFNEEAEFGQVNYITFVMSSNCLRPSIKRLDESGIIIKWFGSNLNWDSLIQWWQGRWGSEMYFKYLVNGFLWSSALLEQSALRLWKESG